MTTRLHYHLFVDDVLVNTILSGWPMSRILRQLSKKNPDAKRLEVRLHVKEESVFLLKAGR